GGECDEIGSQAGRPPPARSSRATRPAGPGFVRGPPHARRRTRARPRRPGIGFVSREGPGRRVPGVAGSVARLHWATGSRVRSAARVSGPFFPVGWAPPTDLTSLADVVSVVVSAHPTGKDPGGRPMRGDEPSSFGAAGRGSVRGGCRGVRGRAVCPCRPVPH